jgi:hypothetical protein
VRRLAAAALLIAVAACGRGREPGGVPDGDGPLVGFYRATISENGNPPRRVKVMLWAESPDRLHVELVAPVGGVRFALDAGGGRACVVDAAEATAFVGSAGPEAIEALVGIPVSIAGAVDALLSGTAPEGVRVSSRSGDSGRLPDRLTLDAGGRSLALELIRFERGKSGATLGLGEPPPGMATRPLEELASGDALR